MAGLVSVNGLVNGKDSRWLQLEVCREFQRNKCTRSDNECKFSHPPANVEILNGRVTACYDSIKGRCNREKPPCKYYHPPQHLREQLLINGRNHLALKNALLQQIGIAPGHPLLPSQGHLHSVQQNQYGNGLPPNNSYNPYFASGQGLPALMGHDPAIIQSHHSHHHGVNPHTLQAMQQKIPRSDRLEVCREFTRGACKRAESECRFAHPRGPASSHENGSVTVCMDAVKGRCGRDPCRYFHPPLHLQAQIKAAQNRATAVSNNMAYYYAHNYGHLSGQESNGHPANGPPPHTLVPFIQVQSKDRYVHYIRAYDTMAPHLTQPFRAHCG